MSDAEGQLQFGAGQAKTVRASAGLAFLSPLPHPIHKVHSQTRSSQGEAATLTGTRGNV